MINKIWAGIIILSVGFSIMTGRVQEVSNAFFKSAEESINLLLKLAGPMLFWLGMMKIIEESGLINLLAKLFRPLAKMLFPKIPDKHPVLGTILMNFSANLLGLGNSATPLGLKAMEELQELNQQSKKASDAICTFLIINTSGLTLIPGTILALRVSGGSLNPTEIIGTTIFATACSTLVGIVSNKLLINLGNKRNV